MPAMPRPKKRPLTERLEDEILRRAERVDAGLVRVECLHSTLPILRKAGFCAPMPFHRYLVPITWLEGGYMCVAPPRPRRAQ